MTDSTILVRKMDADGRISFRLLNADGSEPAAAASELSTKDHPDTLITEQRYNLWHNRFKSPLAVNRNLHWLSDNNPLLFEEFLCHLENGVPKNQAYSVAKLIELNSPPIQTGSSAHVHSMYRQLIDTSRLLFSLADDGWHGPADRRAWSLFFDTEIACGDTTDHPYFKETMLVIWIMQDTHIFSNPFQADDTLTDLEFIAKRFDEIYAARNELRERCTIDSETITEYLNQYAPLREGSL